MPIYTVGQFLNFQVSLKIVKVFVYNNDVFYIVILLKQGTPLKHLDTVLWGVLNTDGTHEYVPSEALVKANDIVKNLNLNELE